jgi:hypothetical protein
MAAAAAGAAVELVGRAGDDPAGDALMIALSHAGVGHVALLRDPARPTLLVAPASELVEPTLLGDDPEGGGPPAPTAAGPRLDAADIDLGLRYLTAFGVLVVTPDALDAGLVVATDAAAFAGAYLVVLVEEATEPPPDLPPDATVLAAPVADPDGAFCRFVAAYAAALDARSAPGDAFASALTEGWVPEPR